MDLKLCQRERGGDKVPLREAEITEKTPGIPVTETLSRKVPSGRRSTRYRNTYLVFVPVSGTGLLNL